jgi:putative flippase GtrA
MKKEFLIQTFKYGTVGIMNTAVTIAIIWLTLHFGFGISGEEKATTAESTAANILGFAAGLINSFLFNRKWVFRSKKNWKPELARFMFVFSICYIPQLILVNLLNNNIKINMLSVYNFNFNFSFICQITGNVLYTVLNFICNKYYTFKK